MFASVAARTNAFKSLSRVFVREGGYSRDWSRLAGIDEGRSGYPFRPIPTDLLADGNVAGAMAAFRKSVVSDCRCLLRCDSSSRRSHNAAVDFRRTRRDSRGVSQSRPYREQLCLPGTGDLIPGVATARIRLECPASVCGASGAADGDASARVGQVR